MRYNVFISCKKEDYDVAVPVYNYLTNMGLKVFLACAELSKLGQSDYGDAIDDVLSRSEHMIVIASQINYVKSKWVKFEWGTFCGDLQSDYRDGNLLLLLSDEVISFASQLPSRIRHKQFFPLSDYKKVSDYVISSARIPFEDVSDMSFPAHVQRDDISSRQKTDSRASLDCLESLDSITNLPVQLQFSIADNERKLNMILSRDRSFYIGNISSADDDYSWIKCNATSLGIGITSAVVTAGVGVAFLSPVTLTLAASYFLYKFFKDSEVDSSFITKMNEATGFNFSIPSSQELENVSDDQKQYCIVLRVKDNLEALLTTAKTSSSM